MSDDQTMKVHKGWTADKTILKEAKEILKYFKLINIINPK